MRRVRTSARHHLPSSGSPRSSRRLAEEHAGTRPGHREPTGSGQDHDTGSHGRPHQPHPGPATSSPSTILWSTSHRERSRLHLDEREGGVRHRRTSRRGDAGGPASGPGRDPGRRDARRVRDRRRRPDGGRYFGHLVFSTLHTINATETINRISSTSSLPTSRARSRVTLAGSLEGDRLPAPHPDRRRQEPDPGTRSSWW